MKYKVLAHMASDLDEGFFDSAEERFHSALGCSKDAIESIFYDHPVQVNLESNVITIEFEQSSEVNEHKLKEMIKPAFCDTSGHKFPEFRVIEVKKI
ncbi:hypothetical protein MX715_002684 [Vibrio parahaemolyticus]|uniref:hypothetical protein n=1 Tax=Vibrio parahaemolyticus TaxID=670 RepID=UPI0006A61766|nr:hypothetical protein [Vibrio parahaemolyticus]EGQ8947310.1 hypothetical protein [Vibrio parahaemolyticus]EGR3289297.1 hypothetical protein [Vibrio parahaemolyticus]EHH3659927.1 hypothetical protein [Vibrio parahaemolyticus]EJC6769157.1 hypothetical protein [Vibrio parahaemolyticus]EJC6816389.1 hypothetical protein [Vibrio parahaemolyticus]